MNVLFTAIPLLFGAALLVFGGWRVRSRARARRDWVKVDGVVSGISPSIDVTTFVIDFTTVDGVEVSDSPRVSTDIGWYPQGKAVKVWYDPSDPTRFEADVFFIDRLVGPFAAVIGVVLIAGGLYAATRLGAPTGKHF